MEIDEHAPVVGKETIVIEAPIETVWDIQSNLQQWPNWQPGISAVSMQGSLAPGTTFRWKAQGLNIRSTLQDVQPYQTLGWTGKSLGMQARHIWHFEQVQEGTQVTTEESLSGWLTRLLALFDRNFLKKSMQQSLTILKQEAERTGENA